MIMVIGATSEMIKSTLRQYAKDGKELILLARDSDKLKRIEKDLKIYGAKSVKSIKLDLVKIDEPKFNELVHENEVSEFIIAYGYLGKQNELEKDFELEMENYNVNFVSIAKWLNFISNYLEDKPAGKIAVITSVAGMRGRKANYIYGSSKAALTCLLSGLRQRFARKHVAIIEIRPGFVDTPMVKDMKKGALFCSSEKAGLLIYKAIKNNAEIAYIPGFWRYIMFIINSIPESVFKYLKF